VLWGELTGKAEVGGQTAACRKIIHIIAEVTMKMVLAGVTSDRCDCVLGGGTKMSRQTPAAYSSRSRCEK
jgi:hypothetical protein